MRYLMRSSRPTFVPCDSEHAIDDIHVGVREERRICGHRVKRRDVIYFDDYKTRGEFRQSRARNKNERNTIGEPPITPIAGRVTTPTGDSLTTHSLFTDMLAAAATYLFIHVRGEENERFPRPETLSIAFQFDPAPGNVVSCRSLDHKSILLIHKYARTPVDQNPRIAVERIVIRESSE